MYDYLLVIIIVIVSCHVSLYMLPVILLYNYTVYLLLTEFKVPTVSYGPSFFLLIHCASAKHAGHKSVGKNKDP